MIAEDIFFLKKGYLFINVVIRNVILYKGIV